MVGSVTPYIKEALGDDWNLTLKKVCMIKPARTFWEKVTAIHNMHCCFRETGAQPEGRQPPSRHYYDVAVMSETDIGQQALDDLDLLESVRVFGLHAFPEISAHNETAVPGKLLLVPPEGVLETLKDDYVRMQGMVHGDPPSFDWVIDRLKDIDELVNKAAEAEAA
jgi:hypothetical protein